MNIRKFMRVGIVPCALAAGGLLAVSAYAGDYYDGDYDGYHHKRTLYTYTAKALCGTAKGNPLATNGNYRTSINLLNPTGSDISGSTATYLSGPEGAESTSGVSSIPAMTAVALPCPDDLQPTGDEDNFREGFASASTCSKGLVVDVVYTSREINDGGLAGSLQVVRIQPTESRVYRSQCPGYVEVDGGGEPSPP